MNIVLWFGFLTLSFVIYSLFSDGDFSFLMVRIDKRQHYSIAAAAVEAEQNKATGTYI